MSRQARSGPTFLARGVADAGQQQVCHVGACNQQHERDRAHQRQEHQPDRAAVLPFVERHDAGRDVLVGVRVVVTQLPGDRIHLRLRLSRVDTVRQFAKHFEVAVVALLLGEARHVRERQPQVGVVRKLEAFRHHSDDRRDDVVDLDRPADDGRIAAVAVLPDTVAENDDGGGAWPIVFRQEVAPQLRPLANQLERGGGDEGP